MKGLNKHKKVILKALKGVKTHPTADWIYEEVKKEIPNISLGTIYRNLTYLKENNLILKLDYSGIMSRFDGNPKKHPHIVCTGCGKVEDIDLKFGRSLLEKARAISTYTIDEYRLEFSGACKDCQLDSKGGG